MSLRVMVYSHDTFGLGNIRRMLAVSDHLLQAVPGASVLLVTGSPMVQAFRMRQGLDYIKLPCLSRVGKDEYSAKSLGTGIGQLMQLRSELIAAAAREFDPDVLLVDKKPDGVKHELRPALQQIRRRRPDCRIALVLRDILDAPDSTRASWRERKHFETLRAYFNAVLVLGTPDIFDAAQEYGFPRDIRRITHYCGYIRRPSPAPADVAALRSELLAGGESKLVLVTPGGGEDGYALVKNYVAGLAPRPDVHSLIVCGPEMPTAQRAAIAAMVNQHPHVTVTEFQGDMFACMAAADLVVSMAGYNTVCEILSLNQRAVTVPRVAPVQEQCIRAERLQQLGLIEAIHATQLTPARLAGAVARQLDTPARPAAFPASLRGLDEVAAWVRRSLPRPSASSSSSVNKELVWNLASLMS
ncbi:MAG: glycosyltransferase [Bryobacterales bacterium]|nr:glycosyltransferase [Bryobacterales bacterium]